MFVESIHDYHGFYPRRILASARWYYSENLEEDLRDCDRGPTGILKVSRVLLNQRRTVLLSSPQIYYVF